MLRQRHRQADIVEHASSQEKLPPSLAKAVLCLQLPEKLVGEASHLGGVLFFHLKLSRYRHQPSHPRWHRRPFSFRRQKAGLHAPEITPRDTRKPSPSARAGLAPYPNAQPTRRQATKTNSLGARLPDHQDAVDVQRWYYGL